MPAAERALDRAATLAASSWSGRGALERKGDGAAALGRGTRTAAARRPTQRVILGELRRAEEGGGRWEVLKRNCGNLNLGPEACENTHHTGLVACRETL
jgi:hypothetical protein